MREIERGEIVRIGADGLRVVANAGRRRAAGAVHVRVHLFRAARFAAQRALDLHGALRDGARSWRKEHPVDADVVMAVPDSAVPGGIGYAAESGLPYIEGLIKNRYIGRTFISPDQNMRTHGVQLKFNPIVENLRGQRVIVVDDSIVRGTTTPRIVALLREAGAREVHLRITSPPIKHPCYLGVDMATYDELIAANYHGRRDPARRPARIRSGYLSLDGLIAAVGRERERDVPRLPDRRISERSGGASHRLRHRR